MNSHLYGDVFSQPTGIFLRRIDTLLAQLVALAVTIRVWLLDPKDRDGDIWTTVQNLVRHDTQLAYSLREYLKAVVKDALHAVEISARNTVRTVSVLEASAPGPELADQARSLADTIDLDDFREQDLSEPEDGDDIVGIVRAWRALSMAPRPAGSD
ncbi:hypothetical protein PLICRDRAFT_180636 [Plicaturopsis crispa FD-325 SS-3]|uniref:Uncharacterized protein n=1 Tax=Plicaturopsis crispa FD-325 SS-3 TaxID=944288 RepID=A0A0C9SQ23_PLICR|nr:hypothetical protein PLICRDRAFT_180636 [Plicaturopsis crispa FD-325 SS-3]